MLVPHESWYTSWILCTSTIALITFITTKCLGDKFSLLVKKSWKKWLLIINTIYFFHICFFFWPCFVHLTFFSSQNRIWSKFWATFASFLHNFKVRCNLWHHNFFKLKDLYYWKIQHWRNKLMSKSLNKSTKWMQAWSLMLKSFKHKNKPSHWNLKQEFHAIIGTSSTIFTQASKVAKFHAVCSSLENYNIHSYKRANHLT
jgi:hypothetical protein